MTLRFGTDGVRGVANTELTPEYALAFGATAAKVIEAEAWIVGRDTRISGPVLEAALSAGLAAEGAEVRLMGVCPTPAVALATTEPGVAGAMISASHNPFGDNGLKLFRPGGAKLTDEQQDGFEPVLDTMLGGRGPTRPSGAEIGTIVSDRQALDRYAASSAASIEGRDLAGLRIVIDCANGSAHEVAPRVLRLLGADVEVIAAQPDGRNINAGCGSTHIDNVAAAVRAKGAALGLAFDGDADRVLAVDASGAFIDGDQLMGICALDLRERGRLARDTVVVTVMTNLGFRLGMASHGVEVVETAVGDRYVLEALDAGSFSLGGEQSGHVIFRDLATTGDGLLTAVQVLDVARRSGASLRDLADRAMTRLPQVLINVDVAERRSDIADLVAAEIEAVEARLGETGRVLIRPSGTEPLVRVMVEAAEHRDAQTAATELADAVRVVCQVPG